MRSNFNINIRFESNSSCIFTIFERDYINNYFNIKYTFYNNTYNFLYIFS